MGAFSGKENHRGAEAQRTGEEGGKRLPLHSSFPRKREGGFTFEVQQLGQECLGWGLEVQAFSRGIVVGGGEGIEDLRRQLDDVPFEKRKARDL